MTKPRLDLMKVDGGRLSAGDAFQVMNWIENNFDQLAEAAALQSDTIVPSEDDNED